MKIETLWVVELRKASYNDDTDELESEVFVFWTEEDAEAFMTELLEDDGLEGLDRRDHFRLHKVGTPNRKEQTERFWEYMAWNFRDEMVEEPAPRTWR